MAGAAALRAEAVDRGGRGDGAPGLELREVEKIVHQIEQRLLAVADAVERLAGGGRELLAQDLGLAEYDVR